MITAVLLGLYVMAYLIGFFHGHTFRARQIDDRVKTALDDVARLKERERQSDSNGSARVDAPLRDAPQPVVGGPDCL